ncbi:MAG: ABC transporter ATP-binding protein [Thermomicrobiales bacterium]|nr:ABC transporter ATP-binding protein [Thermomicrobiales bacterium]MCO5220533.1 ABC transporter ATP-binding protein [Thermomicrobiales bacterium]
MSQAVLDQTAGARATTHEDAVIRTVDLTKRFGSFTALNQIDLSIPRGAIGLLGPNGAGKTTLIRILLGLAKPTSGSAEVLGFNAFSEGIQVRERVGYMPEAECLPSNATAADFVGHMAEMSGLPKTEARQRAADVLYQVGLDEERYRLIKGFSTGMKQRVKLAQAIVHDPSLVFLDEPTAGLDPPGRDSMLELVDRIYRMMGMTVVLSSHILEDIERVCDYVVIIDSGQLALAQRIGGTPAEGAQLSIQIDGNPDQFIQRLHALGIDDARQRDRMTGLPEIVIRHPSDRVYDAVRDIAVELDVPIVSMTGRTRSLEDLYLQAVGASALDADMYGGV